MPSLVWTLTRPRDLLWRDWGDFGAAYDAASGDTHLLNALAVELLALLHEAPLSESALASELADALTDEAAIAAEILHTQLTALQGLGLVAPQAAPA